MPSASSVKVDKQQVNPETTSLPESSSAGATTVTPLRQVVTLVEHKIRNLEKRKAKLESYRDLQSQGKELNADQKTAVAKFSEVSHTLEFARDIYKQISNIFSISEKEDKKKAKKEAIAKNQAELARLREILLVQDALNQMGNDSVREDFLNGRNGAAQLSEADLKLLDDLYPAVTPKHEAGNPTAFTNEVQAAAEHLLAVVDGKQKEIFAGTYSQIKEVLGKIHESGYFDQVQVYEGFEEAVDTTATDATTAAATDQVGDQNEQEIPMQQMDQQSASAPPLPPPPPQQQQQHQHATHHHHHHQMPAPIDQLKIDELPSQSQQIIPPPVSVSLPSNEPQQMFYHQQQQQPAPPPRPISEMLGGTGSFYFLQESEIDTPPEQIPSQTFTNQNYVSAPPPPIPLPPMFQTAAQQQQQQQPPINMMAAPVGNPNGGGDEFHKRQHRSTSASNQSSSSSPSPYYQNNNGYNVARPKQQRNGGGSRNRH